MAPVPSSNNAGNISPISSVGKLHTLSVIEEFNNIIAFSISLIRVILIKTFVNRLEIDCQRNHKSERAIRDLLSYKLDKVSPQLVIDGPDTPYYELADGVYKLDTEIGRLFIELSVEKIIVTQLSTSTPVTILKSWFDKEFKKRCSSIIAFYPMEKDNWSFPFFRRPRSLDQFRMNMGMSAFSNALQEFKGKCSTFIQAGIPYRYGYLLVGEPNTGKSTAIEYAAAKYEMSIYMLTLNVSDLNDTSLLRLIASVPANSIIVLEEFDRQLTALFQNKNAQITEGGILTALDGPQRLSHGTIIIATTNNLEYFNTSFGHALIRTGRIDKTIKF